MPALPEAAVPAGELRWQRPRRRQIPAVRTRSSASLMLSRPLPSMLVPLVLGWAVVVTACSRRAEVPPEPHLLAALFDCDESRSMEWSHTPQLAIYDDGRFIIRRDVGEGAELQHSYWSGELEVEERLEVNALVQAAATVRAPDPIASVAEWGLEPETLLVFRGSATQLRMAIGGRWSGPESAEELNLPPELLRWLVFVTELRATTRPLAPWEPAAMRVRLVRMRPPATAGAWPRGWPAPQPAADPSGIRREATVPVRSAEAFWAAFGGKRRGQAIAWEGKLWRAHVFPAFPRGEAWRDLVVPSADEPAPRDVPVWFEAASLIARADRVKLARETEREPGTVWADRGWIRRFAAAIEQAQLGRSTDCFCIGPGWAEFEQAGQRLLWVSAIHGDQLRIYVGEAGGDYKVSAETWRQVNELLTEATRDGVRRPQPPATPWGQEHPTRPPRREKR